MPSFRERLAAANAQARGDFEKIKADRRRRSKEIKDQARADFAEISSDLREQTDQIRSEAAQRKAEIRAKAVRRRNRDSVAAEAKRQAREAKQAPDDARRPTRKQSRLPAPAELEHQPHPVELSVEQATEVQHSNVKPATTGRVPGRVARMPIVRVAYCELDEEPADLVGYAYRWPLEEPPEVGDRVFVSSGDSRALNPAVVVGLDRGEWTHHMKWVRRLATRKDYSRGLR